MYCLILYILTTFNVVYYRVYEQPVLLQPNPETLVLEAHIVANPKPKVKFIISEVFKLKKVLSFSMSTEYELEILFGGFVNV